jgi:hypothetical protein
VLLHQYVSDMDSYLEVIQHVSVEPSQLDVNYCVGGGGERVGI